VDAAARAIVQVQRALRADPIQAAEVGRRRFPRTRRRWPRPWLHGTFRSMTQPSRHLSWRR
jgi:hypothetical protein